MVWINRVRMCLTEWISCKLSEKKAQILLPSVLLVPLFILVVYLLFDLTNLSISKNQHQFALDNAAYSQMSSVSSYLNAMAMINGPVLYRVMYTYQDDKVPIIPDYKGMGWPDEISVFDLFYLGGAFPSIGPDHEKGLNGKPRAESTNWDLQYSMLPYDYKLTRNDNELSGHYTGRADWMRPQPKPSTEAEPIMNWDIIEKYQWTSQQLLEYFIEYLKWPFYEGDIYRNQTYMFEQVTKNAYMFREGYSTNVKDCKPSECAKQSARVLSRYLKIHILPFELKAVKFYSQDYSGDGSSHVGNIMDLTSEKIGMGRDIFMFSYADAATISKLRVLERGVVLKQPFKTPANSFGKNLTQKYKPFTRVTVSIACPRRGNNCVWPNPLPKYNIILRP